MESVNVRRARQLVRQRRRRSPRTRGWRFRSTFGPDERGRRALCPFNEVKDAILNRLLVDLTRGSLPRVWQRATRAHSHDENLSSQLLIPGFTIQSYFRSVVIARLR